MSRTIDNKSYQTSKDDTYYRTYERIFAPFADQPVKVLELGVDRGGSLLVWRDFFPAGTIIGLDKDPVEIPNAGPRVYLYEGLQEDSAILDRIRAEHAPDGFDIIIDDACHFAAQARASFRYFFPRHVKPGGYYVVEDWGTGYWQSWQDGKYYDGSNHTAGMVGFVKELVDELGMYDITDPLRGIKPVCEPEIEDLYWTFGQVFVRRKLKKTGSGNT